MTEKLTHFDARGAARMVDVADKAETHRVAVAGGRIRMRRRDPGDRAGGHGEEGRRAGRCAHRRDPGAPSATSELIPLCHPVALTSVAVEFAPDEGGSAIECRATVECTARTGVEMEALTAVQVALLTIYDMCKAVDRGMTMESIRLLEKRGGKSGTWVAP